MSKCFLDTNILTDWVIINSEIEKKDTSEDKINYLRTFKNIREVSFYSYLLLEILRSNEIVPNFEFFTSRVAIAELTSNIKERYIAEELFRKLIPIKYLQLKKVEKEFLTDIFDRANTDIRNFIQLFIKSKKLTLCETIHSDTVFDDSVFDSNVIGNKTFEDAILTLILKEDVDTYDSILISQSIIGKCDFFVTSDNRLRVKINGLKIVKSNEIYNKIKDIVEKPTLKL